MDAYILEQKQYDHTQEWNEAGWTGKGINIWDMESATSNHGKRTHQRVLHAALIYHIMVNIKMETLLQRA